MYTSIAATFDGRCRNGELNCKMAQEMPANLRMLKNEGPALRREHFRLTPIGVYIVSMDFFAMPSIYYCEVEISGNV